MDKPTPEPLKNKVPLKLDSDPRLTLERKLMDVSAFDGRDDERFETQFYEELMALDPCNEDVLILLGHTYTRRGDYHKGLAVDRRLVRLRPSDATAFYNLACSHSLLKHTDEAFEAIRRAVDLGYRDMAHMLKDPDLANLRADPRFRRLILRLVTKGTDAGKEPANS